MRKEGDAKEVRPSRQTSAGSQKIYKKAVHTIDSLLEAGRQSREIAEQYSGHTVC
jgi:hypothetical protein